VNVAEPALDVAGPSRGTRGRQQRGRETRRNLLRTAARLWGERGFDSVTVEEICSEAGVGRTTFYLHFESKERLLASLAAATALGVADDLRDASDATTLDAQLDVLVRGIVRRMQAHPKSLAQLVINSQRLGLMKAGPDDIARATRFADLARDVLADARRRGELVRDADPAELGEILGALTMDAIEAWASERSRRSLLGVLRFRFALVVDQFRTDREDGSHHGR
jgi:AcrR family transcriptional regulator